MSKQVGQVEAWWDEQDPSNAGWYVRVLSADGTFEDDSMKIWFPVEVDQFDESQSEELRTALEDAFPDHDISVG